MFYSWSFYLIKLQHLWGDTTFVFHVCIKPNTKELWSLFEAHKQQGNRKMWVYQEDFILLEKKKRQKIMFKCAVLPLLQVIRWFCARCLWIKTNRNFFISSVWFSWQIISLKTFLSIYLGSSMLINVFHSICVKILINISYFLLILYFFELIFRCLPILLCVLSNNCLQQSYLVDFSRKPCSTQLHFL